MPIVRQGGRLPYYSTETREFDGIDPETGKARWLHATVVIDPERWTDDADLLTLGMAPWWESILPTLGDYEALLLSLTPPEREARVRALGYSDYMLWETFMDEVAELEQRIEECRRFLDVKL